MLYHILKSKIHRARVTRSDVDYEGSLGIDMDLLDAAGIFPYERILVVNMNNGARLETYAIPCERGSKQFILNGAAARRGAPGDVITIMSFAMLNDDELKQHQPRVIILDENNNIIKQR
ncbi:MAG: aspartate 1-decarboxylase [Lentisphaerae bacterium]|nr:MAG: aspartate 1-decarboxylase [Lentisphaerota bacterium]